MKNKEFQQLLNKVSEAHKKYLNLLIEAEEEYERRYGNNPSDVDDDFWIDTFHTTADTATVAEIEHNAKKSNS